MIVTVQFEHSIVDPRLLHLYSNVCRPRKRDLQDIESISYSFTRPTDFWNLYCFKTLLLFFVVKFQPGPVFRFETIAVTDIVTTIVFDDPAKL